MTQHLSSRVFHPEALYPMFEANGLLGDTTALRKRLSEDGYLFFRDVLPKACLGELRDKITRILADLGWILDGVDRLEARAIGMPQREGEQGYFEALDRLVSVEQLYSLAHDPGLMSVMRQALGESAFPHPLSITRLVFPNNPEITTPPHQDYRNNQGTVNLTAAWIPLADCDIDQGGLAILEGSQKAGLLPLQYHLGPGNRAAVLSDDLMKLRWVSANFKLGDVLLFPALTVHTALVNKDSECMRLSVDFRYQLEGEALTEGCLHPHFNRVSWEKIYANWMSTEFQYYWKNKKFMITPWDDNMHKLPESHLKEAIQQGIIYEKLRVSRHEANPLRKQ